MVEIERVRNREPLPSGLHRRGSSKWERQVFRYWEIVGLVKAGRGDKYRIEGSDLARQIGQDFRQDTEESEIVGRA